MKYLTQSILIFLITMALSLSAQQLTRAQQPAEGQVFLPIVASSGGATNGTPTPTPTVTVTPVPTAETFKSVEFPQQGVCPTGFHLVQEDGGAGILGDDQKEYQDALHACIPNETVDLAICSEHGTAQVIEGVANCSCQEGYGGESCDLCLPGFELNSSGVCSAAAPQPTIEISGSFASLEAGQIMTLTASTTVTNAAGGPFTQFVWSLPTGALGCLKAAIADPCTTTLSNQPSAIYVAPDTAPNTTDEINMVEITVGPVIAPQSANTSLTPPKQTKLAITLAPSAGIPINGSGDVRLMPIVRAVRDFMHHRCVGAGVVGVSYYGKPIGVWGLGRMNGRAELNAPADCGDDTANPYYPNASLVLPNTPFRLGSVSKSVTAAIVRLAVEAQWKKFQPGVTVTQEMIEALPLLAGQAQIGKSLLPSDLVQYYTGAKPVPWVISPELGMVADPRWVNATLGNMLSHRGGLPRSAPEEVTQVTPNLVLLRGLNSESAFVSEQDKLINQHGAVVVENARTILATALGVDKADVYLLPAANLEEILIAVAGRKLARDPGSAYEYSNTDPAYWLMIAENLTGLPFVAKQGAPNSHIGSLVHDFFKDGVGVNTTGNSGLFVSQAVWPPVGTYTHAQSRAWDNGANTYYPLEWDRKHPHCIFGSTTCSFTSWMQPTGNGGRINYSWQLEQVPFPFVSNAQSPGTGNLLSDAKTFLKFMGKHWVGGYDANPRIGEKRNGQWNLGTGHNGSLGGGLTYALQLANNSGATLNLPPRAANGTQLTDGFSPAKVDQIRLDVATDKLHLTYDGQSPKQVDVSAAPGDKVAIGYASTEGRQSVFHAQTADGNITVRNAQGDFLYSFSAGFAAGASLALGNIDADVFDEVFIAKPATGAVVIYEHTGEFIRQLVLTIANGDRMAVGDYNGNGAKDILIARANGTIDVYPNNSGVKANTLSFGVTANDGFAVGNVLGVAATEELVIGRKASGKIEIYIWNATEKTAKLFTSFAAGYDNPAGLTVARFNNSQHRILVARLSNQQMNAYVNVPDSDGDGTNDYLTFKEDTIWSPLHNANTLLAGGHLSGGFATYLCSNANGTTKKMPAGVDLFVAINQTDTDRSCLVNGHVDANGNCDAYSLLDDFALYGVCQVDWSTIQPQLEVVVP